jgi:4-hydroxy-tetrahydrodipicolinate synthase
LVQLRYISDDQFKTDFYTLMELAPQIVMLQDWSSDTYGLPDELIMELFERVPAFRCLKVETVLAGVKYSRMLELSNGAMHISGGWAVMQMPEALKRGVHAFMPTGMHWIYTKIFDLYQGGACQDAIALFHEVLPVLAFSNQHLDISIHFFKRLLWRQGIYPTNKVRITASVFDQVHQDIADTLIEKVMQIEKRLKANHN